MQVILLERVPKLGQMGDTVTVKDGFARNYLLPQNKALRASKDNIAYFETQRVVLEGHNLTKRTEAQAVAETMKGLMVTMIRQAGESGHLYGSVSAKDIAEAITASGIKVERSQVNLGKPIKELGIAEALVRFHPEVEQIVRVNVALTDEEAAVQKARFEKGEKPIQKTQEEKAAFFSLQDADEDEEALSYDLSGDDDVRTA